MRYSLTVDQLRLTPENSQISNLELSLKRDGKRISTLQAKLFDPGWDAYSNIRDPGYRKVLAALTLAPDGSNSTGTEVFQGWIGSTTATYPPPESTSIVAYDKTLEARRNARYKTFSKKTSTQLVQDLAKTYGLDLDIDTADIVPKLRTIDIGAEISDWDQVVRALRADGLYIYERLGKLYVRRNPSKVYPTTFKRGDPIISLEVTIHRAESAQTITQQPLEHQSSFRAATGSENAEAAKQESSRTTHSSPAVAGTNSAQAHAEQIPQDSASMVTQERRRKDEAVLVIPLTPDINLDHKIRLSGWGGKADGDWYIEEIQHLLLGDYAHTKLSLTHSISQEAVKATALPLGQ